MIANEDADASAALSGNVRPNYLKAADMDFVKRF